MNKPLSRALFSQSVSKGTIPRSFLQSALLLSASHHSINQTGLSPVRTLSFRVPATASKKNSDPPSFSRVRGQFFNSHTSYKSGSLEGNLSYTVAALGVILAGFLTYWQISAPVTESTQAPVVNDATSFFKMTADQVASGHVGNLSAEQEEKLKQFWHAIFGVCGLAEKSANADAAVKEAAAAAPEPEAATPKKRFSFFRGKEPAAPSTDAFAKGADSDDKFGLTKQFNDALAKHSPETIRETIWSMMKHDHPDALALRFLRARKWDVQKALIMLVSALDWRHTQMKVDDDIMKNGEGGAMKDEKTGTDPAKTVGADFLAQLRMGKSFLHGVDKENRPICIVRVRLHRHGEQCTESIEKYTVHIIETARLALERPIETATIIFDMTSFSLANMDYAPVKFMIKCFEANYPESLGAVLIHNAPWVFQGIWRIIRGWLDPVVAAKVHFTNGRAGLEEFIEPSRILKELGGDEDWEYEYKEPTETENDIMKDTKARDELLEERQSIVKQVEEATLDWIKSGTDDAGKEIAEKRNEAAEKLRKNYWKLDPYVRARSLYDRQGVIGSEGSIQWYPSTATANDTANDAESKPNGDDAVVAKDE